MPGIRGADGFAEALRQFEQSGMSNQGTPLYSGTQQQAQQQSGPNNPFQFAGQRIFDAAKQGFSGLGDFLFGVEDFVYMERSKDSREDATRRMQEKAMKALREKQAFDMLQIQDNKIQQDRMNQFGLSDYR